MAQINHNISSPNDDLGDQLRTAFGNQNAMNTELYATKVSTVGGKDLSANDFTNTLKAKLDALNAGAEVNVQSDWEQNDNTADDYIKNKPAELFSSVGSFHYVDLATVTTPLTVLATVEKKITNDTASTETNVLNAPYGISSMWDSVNSQLDFSQTSIGDLVTVIPAIEITTTATNQTFQIYLKTGIGSATPLTKQVYNGALAVAGSVVVNATRDFTVDTLDLKDYPAEIYILSSANATVKSGELDIKVVRKDINVLDLPTSIRQDINFGTISGGVMAALNTKLPNIAIQDQNIGQVKMQGTFSGVYHEYLFTGVSGMYGTGALQCTLDDFLELGSGGGGTSYDDTALVAAVANKVDKVAGKSLIDDTEITRLAGVSNVDISNKVDKVAGESLILDTEIARLLTAQKNSDITKAEIEAKLTGEITSHTHPAVGGGGDMVLASSQTVSGLKTFLSGMFGLRNVANTFTSFFANSNTAARTYTLQNRDGTLLDNIDLSAINTSIATKMANPAGTANYLSKFLTATTIGISRLLDTGTYFGLGTANTPTKDITLGNQANREIGIEQSESNVVGKSLIIRAGRTINFILNVNFNGLNQTTRDWTGVVVAQDGNVYASATGNIYKQTAGTGVFQALNAPFSYYQKIVSHANGNLYVLGIVGVNNLKIFTCPSGSSTFTAISETTRNYIDIAIAPNGNVYATVSGGDIYMQTNGTGSFNAIGETVREWRSIAIASNNNVYITVNNGDIYKQALGVGAFVGLGQTAREWRNIVITVNNNIYANVRFGDIYMQTNSTGAFVGLGQSGGMAGQMVATPSNNIYVLSGTQIYMQTSGSGNFNSLNQIDRNYTSLYAMANGNVYATTGAGDIYLQNNDAVGTANLDGGTLKNIAGTGKGAGKSRYEVWTGQKTSSETDMQIETLREYVDENGYHIYTSMPVYADNAAAIAGGLPVGCEYRTATGIKMIVY